MVSHSVPAGRPRVRFVTTRLGTTDGTEEAVAEVERALQSPSRAAEMAERNFQLAEHFYSFAFLGRQSQGLLGSFTGEDLGD